MTKETNELIMFFTIAEAAIVVFTLGILYCWMVQEKKIIERTGELLTCFTFIGVLFIAFAVAVFTYNKTHCTTHHEKERTHQDITVNK